MVQAAGLNGPSGAASMGLGEMYERCRDMGGGGFELRGRSGFQSAVAGVRKGKKKQTLSRTDGWWQETGKRAIAGWPGRQAGQAG